MQQGWSSHNRRYLFRDLKGRLIKDTCRSLKGNRLKLRLKESGERLG